MEASEGDAAVSDGSTVPSVAADLEDSGETSPNAVLTVVLPVLGSHDELSQSDNDAPLSPEPREGGAVGESQPLGPSSHSPASPAVDSSRFSLSGSPTNTAAEFPASALEAASELRAPATSGAVIDDLPPEIAEHLNSMTADLKKIDIVDFFAHIESFVGSTFAEGQGKPKTVIEESPAKRGRLAARAVAPPPAPVEEPPAPPRFKKAKLGKPRATKNVKELLSPESPLIRANLRKLFNARTWDLLTPEQKDDLLQYLPKCDKQSAKSVEDMFYSSCFQSCFPNFQSQLSCGDLDQSSSGDNDFKAYLKGQRRRTQLDPWKAAHYEEWYGQKYNATKPEEPDDPFVKPFSFVEWHLTHPLPEAAEPARLEDITTAEKPPKKRKSDASIAAKAARHVEDPAAAERRAAEKAEKKEREKIKYQRKKEREMLKKEAEDKRKVLEMERRREEQRLREEARAAREEQHRIEAERKAEKQRLEGERRRLEREKRKDEQRQQTLLLQQRSEKVARLRGLLAERARREEARRAAEAARLKAIRDESERKRHIYYAKRKAPLPWTYRRAQNRRFKECYYRLREERTLDDYLRATAEPTWKKFRYELDIGPRVPILEDYDEIEICDDADDMPTYMRLSDSLVFVEEGGLCGGLTIEFEASDAEATPPTPPPAAVVAASEEDAESDIEIPLGEFEDVLDALEPEERLAATVPAKRLQLQQQHRRVYEERVRKPSLKRQSDQAADSRPGSAGKPTAAADAKRKRGGGAFGFRDAAVRVLTKAGRPMSALDIVTLALKDGLMDSGGKTPQNTMASMLHQDIQTKGDRSRFVKTAPNLFGLRSWQQDAGGGRTKLLPLRAKRKKLDAEFE